VPLPAKVLTAVIPFAAIPFDGRSSPAVSRLAEVVARA